MKKLIAPLSLLVLMVLLTGCGGNATRSDDISAEVAVVEATPAAEPGSTSVPVPLSSAENSEQPVNFAVPVAFPSKSELGDPDFVKWQSVRLDWPTEVVGSFDSLEPGKSLDIGANVMITNVSQHTYWPSFPFSGSDLREISQLEEIVPPISIVIADSPSSKDVGFVSVAPPTPGQMAHDGIRIIIDPDNLRTKSARPDEDFRAILWLALDGVMIIEKDGDYPASSEVWAEAGNRNPVVFPASIVNEMSGGGSN